MEDESLLDSLGSDMLDFVKRTANTGDAGVTTGRTRAEQPTIIVSNNAQASSDFMGRTGREAANARGHGCGKLRTRNGDVVWQHGHMMSCGTFELGDIGHPWRVRNTVDSTADNPLIGVFDVDACINDYGVFTSTAPWRQTPATITGLATAAGGTQVAPVIGHIVWLEMTVTGGYFGSVEYSLHIGAPWDGYSLHYVTDTTAEGVTYIKTMRHVLAHIVAIDSPLNGTIVSEDAKVVQLWRSGVRVSRGTDAYLLGWQFHPCERTTDV